MKYFLIIAVFFCLNNCNPKKQQSPAQKNTLVLVDSFSGKNIADTIIYDVIIKNPNPDDQWTNECLKSLKKDSLIDMIFELAYSENADVYDFFTGEKLTKRSIKKLEKQKDFNRDLIGKIQFTERWYFDPINQKMNKKILSMTLGYEIYYSDSIFGGYKPAFKITMK